MNGQQLGGNVIPLDQLTMAREMADMQARTLSLQLACQAATTANPPMSADDIVSAASKFHSFITAGS